MTTSELPNLSREQQKQLQDNCRDLREKEANTRETIQALLESDQMTNTAYQVITRNTGLELETFVVYGISVSNQITQEAGTDFRIGKVDLDTAAIVWTPVTQDFSAFEQPQA